MDTHELAKELLDRAPADIRLFTGFAPGSEDKPLQERSFLTCPFDIGYSEDGNHAVIIPPSIDGGVGPTSRKFIENLFTESELKRAGDIKKSWEADERADKPSLAVLLQEALVTEEKMKHIDGLTGQENDQRYMAYTLETYLRDMLQ